MVRDFTGQQALTGLDFTDQQALSEKNKIIPSKMIILVGLDVVGT
jgi:hypothetical protein